VLKTHFTASILFIDEVSKEIVNFHSTHVWSDENPRKYAKEEEFRHQRFFINVWTGIVGNRLIEPCILPNRLTGALSSFFVK